MSLLLRQRNDLPLSSDPSARFLPWLVAFMVYLAGLSLAGAGALQEFAERWEAGVAGTMTVQLPPIEDPEARESAIDAALAVIAESPAITEVEVLDRDAAGALLEPWLGELSHSPDLPLPTLLAITYDAGAPPPSDELARRLEAAVAGAILDDHDAWLGQLLEATTTLRLLALLIVLLVGTAAVLALVFVARTGLAIHRPVIELLHLMGAQDRYIAVQFQNHAFILGLKGGLIGSLLAAVTLVALDRSSASSSPSLLPQLTLDATVWLLLLMLPLAAAVIAMATARWAVLRTLARLP